MSVTIIVRAFEGNTEIMNDSERNMLDASAGNK